MSRRRRLDWAEFNKEDEPTDLGEGLTEEELYFWADIKREQNTPCVLKGHRLCDKCKNCRCFDHSVGFRCLCAFGKKMVTPYRIRFLSERDKAHHLNREIYCLNHGVYEPKGFICG